MSAAQEAYRAFFLLMVLLLFFVGLSIVTAAILSWPAARQQFHWARNLYSSDRPRFVKLFWQPVAVTLTAAGALIGLWANLVGGGIWEPYRPLPRMNSAFDVVFGGFAAATPEDKAIVEQLEGAVSSAVQDMVVGSDLVPGAAFLDYRVMGGVAGASAESRAWQAEQLAQRIGADVVVYGRVSRDDDGKGISLWPEFYLQDRNLFGVSEISGAHALGKQIRILYDASTIDSVFVGDAIDGRIQLLAYLVKGLASHAHGEYATARLAFESAYAAAKQDVGCCEDITLLMIGNTLLREGKLEEARDYYEASLAANGNYSRSWMGLANTLYRLALVPIEDSRNAGDLEKDLIGQALNALDEAQRTAAAAPAADIETKTHFERGQILLALNWSEGHKDFSAAQKEFAAVIAAYGNGANHRVKEIAAESHARLGLIHYFAGETSLAIKQYQQAMSLLDEHPERQAQYTRRVHELQTGIMYESVPAENEVLP